MHEDKKKKISDYIGMPAFNREGFALLYGGQFHKQGLLRNLPMEYRNITKPSKQHGSCIMQYHEELYLLKMPCRSMEDPNMDPDDADIIS